MYGSYKSQDEQELLLEIPKARGEIVKVTRVKGKDSESLDLRTWYTDKETGELLPTKKGVRFSTESLLEVTKVFIRLLHEYDEAEQLVAFIDQLDAEDELGEKVAE